MTNNSYKTVYAFAREMHPKTVKTDIQYGTAGFRSKATNLGYVMYRMGLLAVLRARYKKGNFLQQLLMNHLDLFDLTTIGVMITASHNPEPDNGVKLIDPHGEMLEQSWEEWATKLANVPDDKLEGLIKEIVAHFEIPMTDRVEIYVGKDTRPSSVSLSKCVHDGILALSGKPVDYGIVTTPQLHFFVTCKNTQNAYGTPTEEGYYLKLCNAFKKIRGDTYSKGNYKNRIFFDGANGVGSKKIKYFKECLGNTLEIEAFNDAIIGSGKLNNMCGADHVKTSQSPPEGVPQEQNVRCCSVDGDADRLVYYYIDEKNTFHLMDGDRIATLVAAYLQDLLLKSSLKLNLGLVQTAYANGASTEYITKTLKVPVACASTGVKHLHHKALDYDIGVYFEANGHGTVIFKQEAKDKLRSALKESNSERKNAITEFLSVIDVINETVGDALSDMLLVETILHNKGWSIQDWKTQYTDLPNRLTKVTVQDRNVITTTDAETKCKTPDGLQNEIDLVVSKYKKGRSFVRPSGTEDIVRIYAEASTQEDADNLALEVASKVYELAGGTGPDPAMPNHIET